MSEQNSPFSYNASLFVYHTLSYIAAPFAIARLYRLANKHSGYSENIRQRFGHLEPSAISASFPSTGKILWLHAVSVGEVIASEPLVRGLLGQFPQLHICITNTTPTGAEQVARSFDEYLGEPRKVGNQKNDQGGGQGSDEESDQGNLARVFSLYAPYDLPHVIDRFLDYLQPIGLVVMETEIWPTWIAKLNKRKLPVLLANGRMSEKSAKGYAKVSALSLTTFAQIDCISAQTALDAERFHSLGAQNVQVTGNLKADFRLTDEERQQARILADIFGLAFDLVSSSMSSPSKDFIGQENAQVLLAASTHAGEDELILRAFITQREIYPELRLLLVPRHPERSEEITKICDSLSLQYRLRSSELPFDADHNLIICDQLGELRALLGLASLVIMGGTFVDHGGHNPLEPAAWGVALIAGPSQRNFDLIFRALEDRGALHRSEVSADSLSEVLSGLLECPGEVAQMGNKALEYLMESGGATQKNIELCRSLFHLD